MISSITPTLDKPGIVRRLLAFPPIWLVLGAAAIVVFYAVITGVASEMSTPFQIGAALIGTAGSIGLFLLTMRVLARRRTPELRWTGGREFLLGGALGAFFIIASVLIVAALGGYTVQWHPVDVFATVMLAVAVNIGAAVIEELVFRGLALQVFEKYVGSWIAIAVTALLFGGAHMLNPGASLWSGFAITVEAGVLIGAAFVWRRNLWFAIGLHFVWNTVESLLGIPVSGHHNPGLFETTVHGDDWLTGGDFGIEASVISVGLSLVLSALMIIAAHRARAHGAPGRTLSVSE